MNKVNKKVHLYAFCLNNHIEFVLSTLKEKDVRTCYDDWDNAGSYAAYEEFVDIFMHGKCLIISSLQEITDLYQQNHNMFPAGSPIDITPYSTSEKVDNDEIDDGYEFYLEITIEEYFKKFFGHEYLCFDLETAQKKAKIKQLEKLKKYRIELDQKILDLEAELK